jgi:hypothetical protein
MTDRPARMPTPKQMQKLADTAVVGSQPPPARPLGPDDYLPAEYWEALLANPRADDTGPAGSSGSALRLAEISHHLLRVGCRRCGRTVEIQKADAVRLYGPDAVWKIVTQRLLDNTCTQRTGRHEEDGCWQSFET